MSSINPFIGSLQLANQIKYNYYRSEGSFLYFCNIYVTTNYDKKTFYWQAELFQWCFVFEFRTFQIFLWWQHISWPSAKSQYFLLQRLFISPAELSCISLHWSSGDWIHNIQRKIIKDNNFISFFFFKHIFCAFEKKIKKRRAYFLPDQFSLLGIRTLVLLENILKTTHSLECVHHHRFDVRIEELYASRCTDQVEIVNLSSGPEDFLLLTVPNVEWMWWRHSKLQAKMLSDQIIS